MENMQPKMFYIEAPLSSLEAEKLNGINHKEQRR
jgi:hypothetical protein